MGNLRIYINGQCTSEYVRLSPMNTDNVSDVQSINIEQNPEKQTDWIIEKLRNFFHHPRFQYYSTKKKIRLYKITPSH